MAIAGTVSFTGISTASPIARPFNVNGDKRELTFDYSGPASYVTGGDGPVVPSSDLGFLGVVEYWPDMTGFTSGGAVVAFIYNYSTSKIQAFNYTTGNEIAGATNLSTYVARFQVAGR